MNKKNPLESGSQLSTGTKRILNKRKLKKIVSFNERKAVPNEEISFDISVTDVSFQGGETSPSHPSQSQNSRNIAKRSPSGRPKTFSKKASRAHREALHVQQETVGAQQGTPHAQRDTIRPQRETSRVKQDNVDVQQEALRAQQEVPHTQRTTRHAHRKTSHSHRTSPRAQQVNPRVQPMVRRAKHPRKVATESLRRMQIAEDSDAPPTKRRKKSEETFTFCGIRFPRRKKKQVDTTVRELMQADR
ncbi:hypothetical protein QE152_g38519 [Popillia japonica]|uniref:Uncharacterized protein n=1 Tax=Popillia japonica TaxID=7064 RepID=A0AAW1HWM6_POPJA